MTMTEYFPIFPLGEGTIEIEAFGSLFCRMAVAHSVSIYALTTHLRVWWARFNPEDTGARKNVVNAMNPMLCGIGPNVDKYVSIVEKATGSRALSRTTLLSLRPAISLNGHQLVRKGRAWCPACMEESEENQQPFYDRLIWVFKAIKRCPVHKVALESQCPHCGRFQSHYHHLGHMTLCYSCKNPLLSPSSVWRILFAPPLYENECLDLVEEISTGRISSVDADAYGIFLKEFADYLVPMNLKISRHTYRSPRRPQIARETARPRFTTLVRRCAAFGIKPSEIFRDPIEAAKSACLLEFARLELPGDLKPRKSADLVRVSFEYLDSRLSEDDYDNLPSLVDIAKNLGVSKGFLNYHHRDLCSRYARHRTGCRNRKAAALIRRAVAYLQAGPIAQYPSPSFPSQDHLVAAVVQELRITVRVARTAVAVALKMRFGRRAYARYLRTGCIGTANPGKERVQNFV